MDKLKFRKRLFIGLMVLSYLPVFLFIDYRSTPILLLGRVFGFFGVLMMTWQFLMGIRGLITKIIPDLIWVNSVHRFMGTYGFLAICIHPILITTYYLNLGINLLIPKFDSPFDMYKGMGVIGFSLLALTWILSAVFRSRIPFRYWKKLHLLVYIILPLVLVHSLNLGLEVSNGNNILHYYWLGILSVYAIALGYRLLLRVWILGYKYKIVEVNKITADTVQIIMQPVGNKFMQPKPGQFIYFQPDIREETHPFSVSHFDNETHMLAISPKIAGPFTTRIQNLQAGKTVLLDGPYGSFTEEAYATTKTMVLIAGGIGITPFLKLLETAKSDLTKKIILIWGNKTETDIPFKDFMQEVTAANPNVKIVHVLSAQPDYKGETGYVTLDTLKRNIPGDLTNYEYFVCGPPIMMKKLLPVVQSAGVNEAQIHREKFSL